MQYYDKAMLSQAVGVPHSLADTVFKHRLTLTGSLWFTDGLASQRWKSLLLLCK